MSVVAFAGLFAWTGSTLGIMDRVAKGLLTISQNPIIVLLLLNFMLLIAGMLMDAISIFYVFLPILIPVIRHFNWDPMWFGVMMAVNLSIGTLTPPVALNLYVAANLADISMERISKAAIPFVISLIVALLIVTYIPSLSLWLPELFGLH
jgi:C4-dicarboxylate transporter DctM subunit